MKYTNISLPSERKKSCAISKLQILPSTPSPDSALSLPTLRYYHYIMINAMKECSVCSQRTKIHLKILRSFIFSKKDKMIHDYPEKSPHQEPREVFLPWGGLVEASLLR